jgi:hypothetical protein
MPLFGASRETPDTSGPMSLRRVSGLRSALRPTPHDDAAVFEKKKQNRGFPTSLGLIALIAFFRDDIRKCIRE